MDERRAAADAQVVGQRIIDNISKVIVGKRPEIELAVIALLGQGHLLIEDVPGVGKTNLAKSLAISIGCEFKRVQFTPDLLPSDITGVSVFNQGTSRFEFRPGPIFAQVVLADEVNRATPKTQSALLECMEERQATIDGTTHQMPEPFLVMATQNPIEYEGTFPLPEAQLDRFLLRMSVGYPTLEGEIQILEQQQFQHPIDGLQQVATAGEIIAAQNAVRHVYVDPRVKAYIVQVVAATRAHADVYLGASPRGSLALLRAGQARALLDGREFVTPDDIKLLAVPTLAHRVILSPSARMKNT
ncbi:MAG TPA: MoxR family ATPase, partial [Dehalococcoidia bacterium]|nr:MoxR family ATPase [Dehalococcoidia bacterium]